jgi:hypothetical protein
MKFEVFGSVRSQIKKTSRISLGCKNPITSHRSVVEVREIKRKLHKFYDREELMFRQKSRHDWLKAGDQNTKYFQNRASHRRRKNTVHFLLKDDGSRCSTDDEM